MTATFVNTLRLTNNSEPEKNPFDSIWSEYEHVIVKSLITSFGLDFMIKDQYGGDVDTIHNVRRIPGDDQLSYKNKQNAADYANRGEYNSSQYHSHQNYKNINKNVSQQKKNGTLKDAYTGKTVARNADIDLDHVIAAKEIHDDPGRILSELDGPDLANTNTNLKPIDRSINRSMKQKDSDQYLSDLEQSKAQRKDRINELNKKDSLSEKEQKELNKLKKQEDIDPEKMNSANQEARKEYNKNVNTTYYTSKKFAIDTAKAAGFRGVQMGARQVLGLIFTEIWFSTKDVIQATPPGCNLKDIFDSVIDGVKKGIENAKIKYKELISKFIEGITSGALSSLTNTIYNIFFTTTKNLGKCIRELYASIVEAGKILLFNPDNLYFGSQIRQASIVIATGASVLVGSIVGELIGKTPIGELPVLGEIVQIFCSTLVSGLISCSLLIFLDRSKLMNHVINCLDAIPSEVNNYAEIANIFEQLTAKLANLDIEKFHQETEAFSLLSKKINACASESELNCILLTAYKSFDINLPWQGDFDTFMGNRSNTLVFS